MTDEFLRQTAEIRRQLTPDMEKLGTQILNNNIVGLINHTISLNEVVRTMYVEMEMKRKHMAYVRVE